MKIYSLQKHIFETFTGNIMQIYMVSNHLKNIEKNSMHTKIVRKSKNINRNLIIVLNRVVKEKRHK